MTPAADADDGNGEGCGKRACGLRDDGFENDGEDSGVDDGLGSFAEGFHLLGGFAFFAIAAFFDDALGEHAEVAHHGDTGGGDGTDFFGLADAAFKFHCFGTGGDEALRGFKSLGGRVIGVDGQVADDKGFRFRPRDGGHMVEHVGESDVGGVWKSEDDHAEGIADEQDVDAAFIEQARGGVVVGGESRDGQAVFAGPDGFCFLKGGHVGVDDSFRN